MTGTQFIRQSAGVTVRDIVALTGATAAADAPLDTLVTDIAPLDRAGPGDLTFIDKPKFAPQLSGTRASVCLASERFASQVPQGIVVLRSRSPYRSLVAVARKLFPASLRPTPFGGVDGLSPQAMVHTDARLESGVVVEAGAFVGAGAEIGSGTLIAPNAVIGPGVRIGRNCAVGPGASISHALIGDRVIVHAGARIGQDGFGYLPGMSGHEKVPQVGRVIVQDDVEIGANTTIDRGAMRDTIIGEGAKIDNLVQIGHNVTIGRHAIIVSQTGISGSAVIGDFAMLGGQVGVGDHLTVGDGAQIAARGGVMSNVPPGVKWGGFPARPARTWLREKLIVSKLAKAESAFGPGEAKDETE
jgi:UDP-3-O-[3-hydroxymyristoyl] glucosamine N-acyltransferase